MHQAIAIVIGAALIATALYLGSPRYQMIQSPDRITDLLRLDRQTGEVATCGIDPGLNPATNWPIVNCSYGGAR